MEEAALGRQPLEFSIGWPLIGAQSRARGGRPVRRRKAATNRSPS
jgi:hypothetical protein